MAITIKEIARLTGVSVGTVDRALHNRGRVRPELAKAIKDIAKENNFKPSQAGRALALAKKPIKIGVVVHLTEVPFMAQVLKGLSKAKRELSTLGAKVIIHKIPFVDANEQIKALDKLQQEGVDAIAISPTEDESLRKKLQQISETIPVVTFNTDIEMSGRSCFIGLDNAKSGKVAAKLVSSIIDAKGKVAIISGHSDNYACNLRISGFVANMHEKYPNVELMSTKFSFDEDKSVREIVTKIINNNTDLKAIFICSGGQKGLCDAIRAVDKIGQIKVVAYDLVPETKAGLEENIITFVIDQDAYLQGYKPIMLLYDKLFYDKEFEKEYIYTNIQIKVEENL